MSAPAATGAPAPPTQRPGTAAPRAPAHRPAPRSSTVKHRMPPRLAPQRGKEFKPEMPWVDYWATSTWPNWQPARPNAPNGVTPYDQHEAARAGIRLMPDQGSLIAGLKARIADLESRQQKLDSVLRLQQQVKALRRENARLRVEASEPYAAQLKSEVQLARSENSALRSQNLALAAQLHRAEKKLKELGVEL